MHLAHRSSRHCALIRSPDYQCSSRDLLDRQGYARGPSPRCTLRLPVPIGAIACGLLPDCPNMSPRAARYLSFAQYLRPGRITDLILHSPETSDVLTPDHSGMRRVLTGDLFCGISLQP